MVIALSSYYLTTFPRYLSNTIMSFLNPEIEDPSFLVFGGFQRFEDVSHVQRNETPTQMEHDAIQFPWTSYKQLEDYHDVAIDQTIGETTKKSVGQGNTHTRAMMEKSVPVHVDALVSLPNDTADTSVLLFSAPNIRSTQIHESDEQLSRDHTTFFPYDLQVADQFELFPLPLQEMERDFTPTLLAERLESRFSDKNHLQAERFTEILDDRTLNLEKVNEGHDLGNISSESSKGFGSGCLTQLKKRCCILDSNLIM